MELFSNLYNKFISKSVFDEKLLCWDADTRYLRTLYALKWEKMNPADPDRFIRAIHVLEVHLILDIKYGVICGNDIVERKVSTSDSSNSLIAHQLYNEGCCESI